MSLKASALKSNESQKKHIIKEVNSILGMIDDELKIAHECDRRSVTVSVPITFSIPYMENHESQRIIYYKILTSLLDRGFHVEIDLKSNASIFEVTWLSKEELKEIDLQIMVLAKHRKKVLSDDNRK
jgi:hypothetical protein